MDKFAADMAVDFRPFGVTAVSIWMGVVLTERVRQIIDRGPELAYLDDIAETPEFTGHVIAALAADPDSSRSADAPSSARRWRDSTGSAIGMAGTRRRCATLMSVQPATYHGRIRR